MIIISINIIIIITTTRDWWYLTTGLAIFIPAEIPALRAVLAKVVRKDEVRTKTFIIFNVIIAIIIMTIMKDEIGNPVGLCPILFSRLAKCWPLCRLVWSWGRSAGRWVESRILGFFCTFHLFLLFLWGCYSCELCVFMKLPEQMTF